MGCGFNVGFYISEVCDQFVSVVDAGHRPPFNLSKSWCKSVKKLLWRTIVAYYCGV
jgi:hypothetical protein